MDERIFDKLNLNSRTLSSDGDMDVQVIDNGELIRKLFFLEGTIGLYNLSKMLEESNLKALEDEVKKDIENGIISRYEYDDKSNLEI